MPISAASPEIRFFYERPIHLSHVRATKATIRSIFLTHKKKLAALTVVFCSDARLRRINKEFLTHDYLTDVITFLIESGPSGIVGEIYVSADRVRENSRVYRVPVSHEARRVIFHGALHLCGFGDEGAKKREKMRERENFFLLRFARTVSRETKGK